MFWFLRGPQIPVAMLGFRIGARVLKPGMRVRGVIHYQIHQHSNAALIASVSKLHEVAKRAVLWIYAVIVGDIISAIAAW